MQRICSDSAVYELQVNFTYSKIHDPSIKLYVLWEKYSLKKSEEF